MLNFRHIQIFVFRILHECYLEIPEQNNDTLQKLNEFLLEYIFLNTIPQCKISQKKPLK